MYKVIRYWKTILWSIIMLVLFLLPAEELSRAPVIPFVSQTFHLLLFTVFTLFLVWDLSRTKSLARPSLNIYLIAIGLSVLYGSLIELLQAVSGFGRIAEFLDVVYDLLGSLVAILSILLYIRFRRSTN